MCHALGIQHDKDREDPFHLEADSGEQGAEGPAASSRQWCPSELGHRQGYGWYSPTVMGREGRGKRVHATAQTAG